MTKYTAKHLAKRGGGPLCLLLALAVLITAFTTLTPGAKAAGTPTSLGLAEAKALVEGLGMIKEGVSKEEAQKIVDRMKEAGATAVME